MDEPTTLRHHPGNQSPTKHRVTSMGDQNYPTLPQLYQLNFRTKNIPLFSIVESGCSTKLLFAVCDSKGAGLTIPNFLLKVNKKKRFFSDCHARF